MRGLFSYDLLKMQDIYFIADLHLQADAPELDEPFIAFCHRIKDTKPYLYILGDLFDMWLGGV